MGGGKILRNDLNNLLQIYKILRLLLMKNGSVSMEDFSDEKLKVVLKISENNDLDSNFFCELFIVLRQNSEVVEIIFIDELLGFICVVLLVK